MLSFTSDEGLLFLAVRLRRHHSALGMVLSLPASLSRSIVAVTDQLSRKNVAMNRVLSNAARAVGFTS